jgi:hypothetical protein
MGRGMTTDAGFEKTLRQLSIMIHVRRLVMRFATFRGQCQRSSIFESAIQIAHLPGMVQRL